jgi:ABC-2 type transport system ATP-binding protein
MAVKKEVSASPVSKEPAKDTKENTKILPSSENLPLIMIKSISKGFHDKLVVKDVSFDIFHKDIFGIIGMSGSGKTTLFNLMSGVIKPGSGDVLVKSSLLLPGKKNVPDYVSVYRNSSAVKTHFGFASQVPSFYEHLTAEENLMMYCSLYGIPKKKAKETVSRLLRLVELAGDKDTISSELSGGMQRRLDIACSLVHDPKVLFLDEPTSDLDPIMRKQIWSLLREINASGTTIILASHILEEVESLCSKVAILHDRRILGHGTLAELRSLFKRNKQVVIELDGRRYDSLSKALGKEKGVERVLETGGKLVVFVSSEDRAIRGVIRAVESSKERLISLDVSDATLSEIFENITKRV